MISKNSLIIILIVTLVLIYLYNHKLYNETFEETAKNTNEPKPVIEIKAAEPIQQEITESEGKFVTDDGFFLKFFKIPVTDMLKLSIVAEENNDTTKFRLKGSYIKDYQGNFIKINTADNNKFKLSSNLLLENDETSNYATPAYWSALLYEPIGKFIYFELNPASSPLYNKCYLNVEDVGILPILKWSYCDPIKIPVLSNQSTKFNYQKI